MKTYYIDSFFIRLLGEEESHQDPKKKLVFLHGLLGKGQNWLPIARALEEDFTILLMDQRGHGKSTHDFSSFSTKAMAEDLLRVTEQLGWSKFSLVGHSLGARVCFNFAHLYPEKLEKLVLEDMSPSKTGEESEKTRRMIESVPVPFSDRKEAKAFFEGEFLGRHGAMLSNFLYSNIEKREPEQDFSWRFSLRGALELLEEGKEKDFWAEYQSISCPTLLMRGERSNHLNSSDFNRMLEQNPQVQGTEVLNAGHWLHFDQRALFVKEISNFLLEQ